MSILTGARAQPGPHRHPTQWFLGAAKDTSSVAAAAGTWDPSAGAVFGRVHAAEYKQIQVIHLHLDVAHASGTFELEVYRNRGSDFGPGSSFGTMTRIATISVAAGESDGATLAFTFGDDADRVLLEGDYLHLQVVTKPGGSGWHATVDVHYKPV